MFTQLFAYIYTFGYKLIFTDMFVIKLILICFNSFLFYKIHLHVTKAKIFKVIDPIKYKIHYFYFTMLLVITYLAYFYVLILILKVSKLFKQIDLLLVYNVIKTIVSQWTIFQCMINSIFLILLLLLLVNIFRLVHQFFSTQMLKVHLYFSRYDWYTLNLIHTNFLHNYGYSKIISALIYKIKSTLKMDSVLSYKVLWIFFNNLSTLSLLFFIVYDSIFNAFILTKIFYSLPFCFFYTQWKTLSNFFLSKDLLKDILLSKYIYEKSTFIENANVPGFYMFENGETFEMQDLLDLYAYIRKDFKN